MLNMLNSRFLTMIFRILLMAFPRANNTGQGMPGRYCVHLLIRDGPIYIFTVPALGVSLSSRKPGFFGHLEDVLQ